MAGENLSYTQHAYNIEAERINQKIRGQKIQGLRYDLQREQYVTQTKSVQVQVAQRNLAIARTDYEITGESLFQRENTLKAAKVETQISQVAIGSAQDRYGEATAARAINQSVIRERLTALTLTVSESSKKNIDRRAELGLRGLLDLGQAQSNYGGKAPSFGA